MVRLKQEFLWLASVVTDLRLNSTMVRLKLEVRTNNNKQKEGGLNSTMVRLKLLFFNAI